MAVTSIGKVVQYHNTRRYQSQSFPLAANSTIDIPLTFLDQALGEAAKPAIDTLWMNINLTDADVGTVNAMRQLWCMISRLFIQHAAGTAYDVNGSSLRSFLQQVSDISDTDSRANFTASTNNQTCDWWVPIPFSLPGRLARGRDTAVPVSWLVAGRGKLQISFGALAPIVTNGATVTGTVQFWAECFDQGAGCQEVPPVLRVRDQNMVAALDYDYPVQGDCYVFGLDAGIGALAAITPWTSTQQISVPSVINMQPTKASFLRALYQHALQARAVAQARNIADTVVAFAAGMQEDAVLSGLFVPIISPRLQQGALDTVPVPRTLTIRTDTAFALTYQPRVVVASFESNGASPEAIALVAPQIVAPNSPEAVSVFADGNNRSSDKIPARTRALLPRRVRSA
jgi:hypothetical protein